MNRTIINITAVTLFFLSKTLPTLAASSVQFGAASSAVAENAGEALLSVTRTGDLETVVSVDYLTADNTARAGEDYTAASGTLSFAAGQTNQILRINILNDGLREATEIFSVTLTNPSPNAVLGTRVSTSVSIQDNDPGIQVEFPQYWAGEGTSFVVVAVVRGPDENMAATVDYTTAAQTAKPGTDYTETSGTLSFTADEKLKLITIPILNDGLKEPDEKLTFKVSNATGDVLGTRTTATITITDNDPGIEFAMNQLWVHEDQNEVCLKVLRGNDELLNPFTVDYTFIDGTAKAGEDYLGTSGALEFSAGEMSKSIYVPVINDQLEEPDEKFQVKLSNPTAGMALGRTANLTATVTIVDATGLEPRGFEGIRKLANGTIQLELAGGVSKPFSNYFSIFQLESSTDFVQWHPLPLLGYLNGSPSPPVLTDLPPAEQANGFYRLNPSFLITPSRPPTGPYVVGTFKRLLTDPSRRNRYQASTNGSFMITVWYPALPKPGQALEPYTDPALSQHDGFIGFYLPQFMDRLPRFGSYSFSEAPLRPRSGGYPIVFISHGFDNERKDNQELAEALASHGYIVVSPDHYDAFMTEFPDGTIYLLPHDFTVAGLKDRVRDLVFVLDTLEAMNQSDAIVARGLDLTRVAAAGWSWGAHTAGEFCRLDDRGKAAISLDWGDAADSTAPDLFAAGLPKPSLMLNSSANKSDILFRKAATNAYWVQIGNTDHGEFSSLGWAVKPNSLPAAREVARTIHAYVLSFLNKYMKDQDDHLLDGSSSDYPRVIGFKKK